MQPDELLRVARDLLAASVAQPKPSQAHLRRAVSTVYYALFHFLSRSVAELLLGRDEETETRRAWRQAYRSLDHSKVGNVLKKDAIEDFSDEIKDFSNTFRNLQNHRYCADYYADIRFANSTVEDFINQAELVIQKFASQPDKEIRAFIVLILSQWRSEVPDAQRLRP